jgi:2',3'-cyclic-nucleotide 2'-phosphodiesterase (5'-nucleotidase family)
MMITKKVGIWLVSALVLGVLVFTGCPTDTDPEPDPGLDWGKAAEWDGTNTTTVLGTASKAISGEGIRYKETPLGNLIADGIAEYARFTSGETVDFAMLNGQNVQGFDAGGIPQGDITLDSLSSGLGDSLFLVTYTGKNIEDIINIFVNSDAYESTGAGWKRNCVVLVSSGVSYTITSDTDPTKPPHATNIKVNGTAIDPNNTEKTYRVAVGNFMAGQNATAEGGNATSGGGANFVNYGSAKKSYHPVTLKQAVAKYILVKGTISPVTEGRISGTVPIKLPVE